MNSVRRVMAATTLLAITTVAAGAQKGGSGFGVGYSDIGPVLGLGSIGEAGVSIGGRFEHGFKAVPDMGNGILGIMVGLDWYHYGLYGGSFTYIPISATVNYHFNVTSKKVDPFIGLGLGYLAVSTSYKGIGSYDASGIYFAGRLGMRYFMTDKVALYGDVGTGGGALHVGLTFKMKG